MVSITLRFFSKALFFSSRQIFSSASTFLEVRVILILWICASSVSSGCYITSLKKIVDGVRVAVAHLLYFNWWG